MAGRPAGSGRDHSHGRPQGSSQLFGRAQRRPPGSRSDLGGLAVRSGGRGFRRIGVGPMVGIVVVSHSQRLAEASVELALQMVRGAPPPIGVAAGLDNHVLGTDAARVKEAIDRVASPDGVLVLMDLGSAVLSAELALELRGDTTDCPVALSDAPLVEGLVAAVTLSAAGASLPEVADEASQAGRIKPTLLGVDQQPIPASDMSGDAPPTATIELPIHNEHGLHARPAARLVETVRRFDAQVTVRDITQGGQEVNGRSVSAL